MNVLDLFSGIGGFSLGLEAAGMRTIGFCEIDPFCRAVLRKHWPSIPCHDDIRTFKLSNGRADVICGGFPCQDVSEAGKRGGIGAARSGLWKEYARIIGDIRPKYIIVENVSGLRLDGMGVVLGDLASLGYDAEWHCIPASAIGAPHKRDRCWIVAYPREVGRKNGLCYNLEHEISFNEAGAPTEAIKSVEGWKRWLIEAHQASDGLISQSDFHSMDDGLSEELDEIASLGNAIVPKIAEIIGKAILEYEKGLVA